MKADPVLKRRMRGVILRLLLQKHERQEHRYDDYAMMSALDRLHFTVYLDLVRELLQDMQERDLLTFVSEKNKKTGDTSLSQIQLRPRGRDLLEGAPGVSDPAVEVE